MSYYGFRPYVPVAKRRAIAARELEKLRKKGRKILPVVLEGRSIARTFWGKAWCENLERYSDFENRLPRGRTYVRNGSVVDLQIERGQVRATVSGSELYTVRIDIDTIPKARWEAICRDCLGSVTSLVELLQGKISKSVMERVCREGDGLFPSPREIKMRCSCPDWADMCKHASAVLYGVGARLDAEPDFLFALRGVDRSELIAGAGRNLPIGQTQVAAERIVAEDDVAALFGLELEPAPGTKDPFRGPQRNKRARGTGGKDARARGERDDAVRRNHGEIALCGVDTRHKVAPLCAGRRAHLVDHGVGLGQRRIDEAADMVNLVRIEAFFEALVFGRRSWRDTVIAHDLGIRPQEQRVVFQELVQEQLLVSRNIRLRGWILASCLVNQTAPCAAA